MREIVRDSRCFYEEADIHFYDCGENHKVRLETLLRHVADIAGSAYTAKGYSHKWLWENGFVFLISRVYLKLLRTPMTEEHLTIETWEREVKGALFFRDVNFYDANGVLVVKASTAWSLVDPHKRTILKPSSFSGKVDAFTDISGDFPLPARLKDSDEGNVGSLGDSEAGRRVIRYSDIDGNGHTYNSVYAGIACDFLPYSLMQRDIAEFQINFKQEALIGEELKVKTCISEQTPTKARVSGYIGEKQSFLCEYIFK